MKNINVNEAYKEIIPLANQLSSATLAYSVYRESDKSTFASGNLTYLVGKQWSFSFTPLVVDEIYIIEVLDSDADVIFTQSYKALENLVETTEDTSIVISKTALVNKALSFIGAESISSILDGTANADIMLGVYSTALKGILSECLWGFATKRALLTVSTTALRWYHSDESYIYDKPTDIVRIFDTNTPKAIWREEGDFILSDTKNLGIKYVYYHDTPTAYKSSFIEAFVDLLACQAAYMVTNNASKGVEMFEKYSKVSLPKAKSENSQTGAQQQPIDDAWINAKYSNGNLEA